MLGKPVYSSSSPPYVKKMNAYYTWDEVIDIDKLLHSEGKKNPKVLYSGWLVYDMRQYDPCLFLKLRRRRLQQQNLRHQLCPLL